MESDVVVNLTYLWSDMVFGDTYYSELRIAITVYH